MPMMLINWEETHIRFRKMQKTLVGATKEIGLEVNADKTKYMIMSRDHNAGRSHSMKIIVQLKGWKSSNIWELR